MVRFLTFLIPFSLLLSSCGGSIDPNFHPGYTIVSNGGGGGSGGSSDPAPTVTSLDLTTGPLAGGTNVTITGTGFLSGATVSFGGSAGTSVSVVSSTTISVTTPAHAAGAVNVVVTNSDSQSGTLSNGYTYQAAPTVTSLSISSGTTSGGTSTTITGTGFISGATVTFGGSAGTSVSVVNATTITVTTPSHAVGAVNVVITNSDSQSGTLTNGFTYTLPSQNIFVTSSSFDGNTIGGSLESADFLCQQAAHNASVSGTWKAILSTSTESAYSRITLSGGGIYNLRPAGSGGPQLVTTGNGLFNSASVPFNNPIGYDETGASYSGGFYTASYDSGLSSGYNHACQDWSTQTPSHDAYTGSASATSNVLSILGDQDCQRRNPFLCIDGQSSGATPSNPSSFVVYGNGA